VVYGIFFWQNRVHEPYFATKSSICFKKWSLFTRDGKRSKRLVETRSPDHPGGLAGPKNSVHNSEEGLNTIQIHNYISESGNAK
jgi:hypothetical protein